MKTKTKLRNGNGRIAGPRAALLGALMMAAFCLVSVPSLARADEPAVAARSPGATAASSERVAGAPPSMADTYGAREANSKGLATFKGGDHVVVFAGSTVVVVLLVVLIVILL